MFKENINVCLISCREDLLKSKHPSIKKLLKKLEKEVHEDEWYNLLDSIILDTITILISEGIDDVEEEQAIIIEVMNNVFKELQKVKTMYEFKIELKGFENEVYRTIEVPSAYSLADLGYELLATFRSDACHLFKFTLKNENFYCDSVEDLEDRIFESSFYASEVCLADVGLKKHSTFTFCYDFGEDYDFKIEFLGKKKLDSLIELSNDVVTDGKGYGIWEDAHYEMNLYYHNRKEFENFLKKNEIDRDNYPMDAKFNLKENNLAVEEDFIMIKLSYETPEDMQDLLN